MEFSIPGACPVRLACLWQAFEWIDTPISGGNGRTAEQVVTGIVRQHILGGQIAKRRSYPFRIKPGRFDPSHPGRLEIPSAETASTESIAS